MRNLYRLGSSLLLSGELALWRLMRNCLFCKSPGSTKWNGGEPILLADGKSVPVAYCCVSCDKYNRWFELQEVK